MIACVGLGLCLARHHLCPEGSAVALRRRGKVRRHFHRFRITVRFLSRLNRECCTLKRRGAILLGGSFLLPTFRMISVFLFCKKESM